MKTCVCKKRLPSNVHKSCIRTNQKLETSQMSIDWWVHEQTAVKSHSGLLLSSKKLITATNSNREESQRHDAKWKEPDTKDDTTNDLLIQNSRKDKTKKKNQWLSELWLQGNMSKFGGEGRTGDILYQLRWMMVGYITVYICQKSSNCIFKTGEFYYM